LLFQLRPGMESALALVQPLAQSLGVTITPRDVTGLYEAQGDPAALSRLADSLRASPFVAYAEPLRSIQLEQTPNDPRYTDGSLWGLSGTNGIKAPGAWDVTTGSTSVVIADIDTGIDYNHPDLYKNIWINQGEIPSSWKAGSDLHTVNKSDVKDVDGDGLITFWDLNDSQNAGLVNDVNNDGRIDAGDVLTSISSGGWEDGISNN